LYREVRLWGGFFDDSLNNSAASRDFLKMLEVILLGCVAQRIGEGHPWIDEVPVGAIYDLRFLILES